MTTSRPAPKIPGADHPITVTPPGRRVTVRIGDTVLADTTGALTLQESNYPAVQYVPLADIEPGRLERTETHTYCPYKGEASYYSLVVLDADVEPTDAVWTYENPYEAVAAIAGHVAFYPDRVTISVTD